MSDSVAYKKSNAFLDGTFIPEYSSVALGLSYSSVDADTFPNFTENYGGLNWKNGIEIGGTADGTAGQTVYYTIYSDEYNQGIQLDPDLALPLAWGVLGSSTSDIQAKINDLPAMSSVSKHRNYSGSIQWLIGQGKYLITNRNYPSIGYRYGQTPLVSVYDPTFIASYPFVGTAVYDLTGKSTSGLLRGSCYWDTNSFVLSPSESSYIAISENTVVELAETSAITISIWFNIQSLPTDSDAAALLFLQDAESGAGNNPQASPGTWLRIFIDPDSKIRIEGDPKTNGTPCPSPVILCSAPGASIWSSLILSISEGGNIGVVLNGVSLSTATYIFPGSGRFNVNSPGYCSIGAQQSGVWPTTYKSGTGFDGYIGAVHIYKGALTVSEMQDLYAKTVGLY
jgi:hypothetical protein